MDWTLRRINAALKGYDRALYAVQPKIGGLITILRRSVKLVPLALEPGVTLWASVPNDFQILPLTHDWSARGRPVEWGILPLMAKIRAMDAWNDSHDGGVIKRLEREEQREEESNRRSVRTLHENLAYESHRHFREAFKDINTATLNKRVATKGMRKNGYL